MASSSSSGKLTETLSAGPSRLGCRCFVTPMPSSEVNIHHELTFISLVEQRGRQSHASRRGTSSSSSSSQPTTAIVRSPIDDAFLLGQSIPPPIDIEAVSHLLREFSLRQRERRSRSRAAERELSRDSARELGIETREISRARSQARTRDLERDNREVSRGRTRHRRVVSEVEQPEPGQRQERSKNPPTPLLPEWRTTMPSLLLTPP